MRIIVKPCVILTLALILPLASCVSSQNSGQNPKAQSDFLSRFHSSSQDRTARHYMQVKEPPPQVLEPAAE